MNSAYLSKSAEIEEKASGFKDLHRTKPNYVINTISKSSTSQLTSSNNNICNSPPISSHRRMIPVDSSGSWRILPNSNLAEDEIITTNSNDHLSYNLSSAQYPPPKAHVGHQENSKHYDETMVYNLNKAKTAAASNNSIIGSSNVNIDMNTYQSSQNQQRGTDQSHIYAIRHPVEYVSTNEAFITETSNDFNPVNNLRLSNLSELNANANTNSNNNNNNNVNSNNYYNSSINLNPNSNQGNNFYTINDDYLNDDSHFLEQNRNNNINNQLAQPHHEQITSTYVQHQEQHQSHYHQSFKKQYSSNNFEAISTNPNVNFTNSTNNHHNNNNNSSFAKYDSDV